MQSDVSEWWFVGFEPVSLELWGKVMSVSMVGLWGSDLWDRYDGVVAHVNRGTEELGGG